MIRAFIFIAILLMPSFIGFPHARLIYQNQYIDLNEWWFWYGSCDIIPPQESLDINEFTH